MSGVEGVYLAGESPFVISDTAFAEFRCCIPVLPGGDGAEDAPAEDRTERCGHPTTLFVGMAPTCPHHLAVAIRVGSVRGVPPFEATCAS